MGIKNISKIIAKHAPAGRSVKIDIAEYTGKTFSIDVPIFMYKYACIYQGDTLRGFKEQWGTFQAHGITPIYVFDGKSSEAKQGEMEKRKNNKKRAAELLEEAGAELSNVKRQKTSEFDFSKLCDAQEKYDKAYGRVSFVPKADDYKGLKEWLDANHIAFLNAPNDAEKVCVELVVAGKADIVVSEDFDVLPYFAGHGVSGKMLTGFGKKEMVQYDLEIILQELRLERKAFVDYCILSGCDFCAKIKNVAGTRALGMVQAHGSIENILRQLDTRAYTVPDVFEYQTARQEFGFS